MNTTNKTEGFRMNPFTAVDELKKAEKPKGNPKNIEEAAARMKKTATKKEAVSHAKPKSNALPPPQVISEIHLIPLDRIEVKAQVRTEFDDASIEELAKDIETHGLLQPVLVNPTGDEKYRLVCGERRLRAIRLLKHAAIPALISKIEEKEIIYTQLAENIQREDMSLGDRVKSMRVLFDQLGSLDAVAQRVKKSKPWVSKLVSLSLDTSSFQARNLQESGKCEDLEILGTLNQAAQLGYKFEEELANYIRKGITRQEARDWIKEAKKQATAATKAEKKARAKPTAKEPEEGTPPAPPKFNASQAIRILSAMCCNEKIGHLEMMEKYTAEEQAEILKELKPHHERGETDIFLNNRANAIIQFASNHFQELEIAAYLHGLFGNLWELADLLVSAMNKRENK